jgi:acetyl-CoA hydrolase
MTKVFQDSMLDFMDSGKLVFASTVAMSLTPKGFERLYRNFDQYRNRIILRPQQIANSPEIIRRLGVIAMNAAVEVDIYGHVNSTLVQGSRMLHGIGGSGDFFRNAYISIVHLPSARKTSNGWISCIVPFASHIDHTEHDISVVVTEQGVADLRGLTPRRRARELIKVAHPMFRPQLTAYLEEAERTCKPQHGMHEPHMLSKAFKMHVNMQEHGTMLLEHW